MNRCLLDVFFSGTLSFTCVRRVFLNVSNRHSDAPRFPQKKNLTKKKAKKSFRKLMTVE